MVIRNYPEPRPIFLTNRKGKTKCLNLPTSLSLIKKYILLPHPSLPIQAPILHRLRHMIRLDRSGAF